MISAIFSLFKPKYICHAFAEVFTDEDERQKAILESIKKYRIRVVKFLNLPLYGTFLMYQLSTPGVIIGGSKYVICYPLSTSLGVKVVTYDDKCFDAEVCKTNKKLSILELKNCTKEECSQYGVKLFFEENMYKNDQLVHLGRPNFANEDQTQKFTGRFKVNEQGIVSFKLRVKLTTGGISPMVPLFNDDNQFVGVYTGLFPNEMLSTREIVYELTKDK